MSRINNVDVDAMKKFASAIEKDPGEAIKLKAINGRWNFEEGAPQFSAEVEYPNGSVSVETDFAPFMGGSGLRPDPVSYCMFGFASCFSGTFAAVAAEHEVELKSLEVRVENPIDLSSPMGVADRPVTEGMNATLRVESEASASKLEEIRQLAHERCPGVYCITNPIPFDSRIES
ncbi:MAG: OsmC family protein [Gemmatimonadetes bacterium]|uniref:OsmC family protein n=1 Tax=Candidatus Kutchimonas denitrificans TaxID=3056748 RepID=A0AAE5CAB2_9BACT|nr:OsmC family protein [Gemmatimonadota bacterium]NIR76306.1 OsmC family protein [Candidatus Kutchimonas denitrificans]NIS02329.1 OsmC family protein [Gemmatimonadota bacterium]NIT68148.1 OsmC family protein [Gemmatimonadota bacterium]NIU54372.1 OsmC family peroxiredoxin [Gemmatimonadota bacterium]